MLSEVTEQMQKQMAEAQKKPGSGECKKPGKKGKPGQGKPSMATMKALQQQLNEQLTACAWCVTMGECLRPLMRFLQLDLCPIPKDLA
jgi:hypothetical protein